MNNCSPVDKEEEWHVGPPHKIGAEGTNRKQQGTWGPAADWVSMIKGCSVTCPKGLENERPVTSLESRATYWVLRSTVWTKAGFVSMEAVTRDVSRDQYHIAEASETETPDFLTLWKPTALRPWILVSHPSLRQRFMLIWTSVKRKQQIQYWINFFSSANSRLPTKSKIVIHISKRKFWRYTLLPEINDVCNGASIHNKFVKKALTRLPWWHSGR